jgi:STE24 endopeptidase
MLTTQTVFYIIIWLTIFEFLLTKWLWYLNTLNWSDKLPPELAWIYDQEKYEKSQQYEKEKYKFSNITSTFSFVIMILILVFWWFWWLDNFVRWFTDSSILLALYFFWIISLVQTIIWLPFAYYSTFVIEEKYWFNKMTKKLFFLDTLKSLVLSAIIGWLFISLIVWIYTIYTADFWILAWIVMTWFSVFFMMFYSTLIVPIFNKQTPLENWELRDAIEDFSKKVWFKLDNIFVIDWSKRSSKANAYFSWLWAKKRIVLYDTLIADLSTEELVAVLAHEIGHYKKKHTLQMLAFSIIQTWFMLYILWLSLWVDVFSQALWANVWSFHVGILAFGILFTPISIILSIFWNILSRKNEYEADNFAWVNYDPEKLKTALISLSKNNLSNLRPHPYYEFFHYSHPTVLKRLNALSKIAKN